jgi:predicted RNase H-like nuclease (RuvC/YqgF family)
MSRVSRPVSIGGNADATLAAVASLVAAHKEQELAFEEARTIMNMQQDEITALKAGREDDHTQFEILKIDCATHKLRIEELSQIGEQKDARISALQRQVGLAEQKDVRISALEDEVRLLKEEMKEDDEVFQKLLNSRKRVRV